LELHCVICHGCPIGAVTYDIGLISVAADSSWREFDQEIEDKLDEVVEAGNYGLTLQTYQLALF